MKDAILIIICIISFVLTIKIVNKAQQMYMKMMGADTMYFSTKKKGIAIFIIWLIISGLISKLFGLT